MEQPKEIDLDMASQHVNSFNNLIKIMRFYSEPKVRFYPNFVPIIGMNLFVFFRVTKTMVIE